MGVRGLHNGRARAAFAIMLATVMALGSLLFLAPRRAFAAPATGLSFTVNVSSSDNNTYSINAYKLFGAEVSAANAAKNISWANSATETAVKAILNDSTKNPASQTYSAWLTANSLTDTPENALDYISQNINTSAGLGTPPATAMGTFATEVAKAIADSSNGVSVTQTQSGATKSSPAAFTGLDEGFYLFYAEGVPAMWTPVSASVNSATIKNPLTLTVQKLVYDDANLHKLTDVGNGQEVTFRVEGDAPNSIPTDTFHYNLTDVLPAGLTYVANSATMQVYDGTTYTNLDPAYYSESLSGSTLTVTCADLYSTSGAQSSVINSTTTPIQKVIFEYKATLNANATLGTNYNENKAQVHYGTSTAAGDTNEDSAEVTSYQLILTKKDSGDGTALQDAEFTLKTTVNGTEYYVQADGTLATTAANLTTNASGKITVSHIDAGVYELEEVTPPNGYQLPSPATFTLTITATKTDTDSDTYQDTLSDLTATITNNPHASVANVTVGDGKVELEITNDPSNVLPITGMTPNQLGAIVGTVLVGASIVWATLIVRRRMRTEA